MRRDERREDRGDDQHCDEDHADDRARVADHAAPGLAPEPGRRLELDLVGFDFGDTWRRESAGLMRA